MVLGRCLTDVEGDINGYGTENRKRNTLGENRGSHVCSRQLK